MCRHVSCNPAGDESPTIFNDTDGGNPHLLVLLQDFTDFASTGGGNSGKLAYVLFVVWCVAYAHAWAEVVAVGSQIAALLLYLRPVVDGSQYECVYMHIICQVYARTRQHLQHNVVST